MDPLPNLNKAYAMVLHQEKQAETIANKSTISSESSAFVVKRVNKGYSPKEGENRTFNPSTGPSKFCEKCGMNNHTAQYCRAHLKCIYCEGKGHTYAYCRKKKNDNALAAGGQIRSKANHVETQKDDKEAASANFPFTREECQHLLNQLITQTKPASANLVGSIPNYEELSGPTIGEDDWDGN
ncbi:uncharacterized protein LOC121052494 [Rosa chinensis]|uniref:uncharacterized protein LOC121052494 n=1 Tax=Rosa chinensis TaxID=74649 RepID=UPI001AD918D7|nr:uncharacterized protein LOC121052494 [Rosa chinensis]